MKDYADQQRRLLQDISNLMLRNRDLLRQREEEERKRREQQKDTEKQIDEAKKDEKEAQEEESSEVPKVVALEDVPQLIVPKDASKESKEKQSEEVAENNSVENEIIPKEEIAVEAFANEVAKVDMKEIPESQANEIVTDEDKEAGDNLIGAARKGDQFRLDLPLTSKIMTLESPAFIPESALPVVVPPSEEEVAREAAEHNASLSAASPEYNPLTFPPSPMVGTAKPIATLTPDAQTQETKKLSPNASPNTRRKFVISRVQESASPVTQSHPPAKHSTETVSASGDSSSLQQSSSFQSPGNGNHGSCSGGDDRAKEPVSLPDNSNESKSNKKDLNENPTATDSVATATSEDAPETRSSDDTTISSKTDNSAKSDTIKSNEPSENRTTDENKTTPTDNSSDSNDTNHNMTMEAQKFPDFHTNMSLNGMKVELANVIDSLDKSGKTSTSSPQGGSQEASNSQGDSGTISFIF